MKKVLLIPAILALGLAACTKENEFEAPAEKSAGSPGVYHVSIPASLAGDTKSVVFGSDGSSVSSMFLQTDNIYVYNETKNALACDYQAPSFGLTPLHPDNDGTECTLTGNLTFYNENELVLNGTSCVPVAVENTDTYTLLYHRYSDDYLPSYFNFDYTNQTGSATSASNHDYAMATGVTLTDNGSGALTAPGKVHFSNLGSMFRQRLTFAKGPGGEGSTSPALQRFYVSTPGDKAIKKYHPFFPSGFQYDYGKVRIDDPVITGEGDIYFAQMFNGENANEALVLTAWDTDGNIYSCTKAAPAGGFANGKYYHGDATMTWLRNRAPLVTGTDTEPDYAHGLYEIADSSVNIAISGMSDDFTFAMNHGGTVALNNLTATNENGEYFMQVSASENLQLVLTGTNTISCNAHKCFDLPYGNLKLSCTGGSATLTVTALHPALYGINAANYNNTTNGYDVSALAADGFTVTRSERTDNADGTCSWTYTVADNTP